MQMSEVSDSEEESFDPMKSRIKEFEFYKLQKEMKEKEEKKKQNPSNYNKASKN